MGNRARGLIAAIAGCALFLLPQGANAWGGYGHRTTAEIALANVTPHTRAEIAKLVAHAKDLGTPECPIRNLEDASVWPDCIRREGWRWGYTAAWHYQTEPVDKPYDPRANCSGGNCVSAQITRNQRILSDESLPPAVRLEALAFLVHFIGDIHQPLHSGDDHDRGGNDRDVDYGIVPELRLHYIWDGPLAERAISSAHPSIVRRYSAAERAQLAGGTPADWGRESWDLARTQVYPGAFGRTPGEGAPLPKDGALSQQEIVAAIPLVQRRIEQAGLRIAGALDAAFAPGKLGDPRRR